MRDWTAIQTQWRGIPAVVWTAWILSALFYVCVGIWKIKWDLYMGVDLGIYHQVLWNSAQGRVFAFSFNEATYLVDHREWLLLLFVPLYWIWDSPITLIVMQSLLISSGVFPLYLLVQHVFRHHQKRIVIGIAAAVMYLLHPTVVNTQLFEFHMLGFALPLGLWWWWSIQKKKTYLQWALFVLLLLLREDVAIMTAATGLLLLLYGGMPRKKAVFIFVVSVVWFAAMEKMGSMLSIEENPTFFLFYEWMGDSPAEALLFIMQHPGQVFLHLIRPQGVLIAVILLMSVSAVPLFAPRYLLPAFIAFLPLTLIGGREIGFSVFRHYGATIVLWCVIAAVYGYKRIISYPPSKRIGPFSGKDVRQLAVPLIVICYLCGVIFFGPHWVIVENMQYQNENRQPIQQMIDRIPEEDAVLSSERFWLRLLPREELYFFTHAYKGKKHFSHLPYTLKPVDWIVFDYSVMVKHELMPIFEKLLARDRILAAVSENGLSLLGVFEQGVVFGRPSREFEERGWFIEEGRQDGMQEQLQRIHPLLEMRAVGYDPEHREILMTLVRKSDESAQGFVQQYPNLQEVYYQVTWESQDGKVYDANAMPIGLLLDPVYDWNVEVERTIRIPFAADPSTIQRAQIHFGTVDTSPSPALLLNAVLLPVTNVPAASNQHIDSFVTIPSEIFEQNAGPTE